MTLIAGFRCTDGFVVAADTEVTIGSISFQGHKLAIYDLGAPDTLCVALSGNVALGMMASQDIRDAILRLPVRELDAIKSAIRSVIECIYDKHVFKLWAATGRNDDDDFSLMIGIEDRNRQFAVLGTNLNSVHEIPHYEFAGMGNQLAHYVTERLCGSAPASTAVTEHLVSQIFREVKGKGVYVGGNTEIMARRSNPDGERFFDLSKSNDEYRFLWGLDDALLSAVRIALNDKLVPTLTALPHLVENRLALIREILTSVYVDSQAERTIVGNERHLTEFGSEYGNPFKDL